MSELAQRRRLGAIMFTDVVGYSSMTDKDEKTALRILEEHRALLSDVFPRYEGVVVKTIGDAFLVEFASAVQAVSCALKAQGEMRKFNERRGQNEKVTIRVAVHVGDIVHSEGDILGDAVNVAARVQALAEPGGICVTQQVVDQVRGKVDCQFVSIGTRELKNIRNPVGLYRVVASQTSRFEEQALDKHRVAVLPLANMSPDPNDVYFADGMTEELISTISRIGELKVISRTSTMRYRDSPLSLGQIAQELGAGSILEGSVRKAGNRVRITAQLIQAEGDQHVWSQSYDRDLVDVFAIQADIAKRVAEALKVHLLSNEKRIIEKKATDSPEAYTLYLKGRHFWNERTESGVDKAVKYFEEAVRADPEFALAYTGLADSYLILADYGWMDPAQAGSLARRNVKRALEIDDSLAEAHASYGLLLTQSWDLRGAEKEYRRAIELRPNYPAAYHWYAINQGHLQRFEQTRDLLAKATALDPYSRVLGMSTGANMFYLKSFDEAIKQLDKVIESNPDFAAAHFWKSLVYSEMGKSEEAIAEAKKAVDLDNGSSNTKLTLAAIYARAGDKESATKALNEGLTEKRGYISPAQIAIIRFRLGEKDEAFRLFQEAIETRDSNLLYLRGSPGFEECESDPRWKEIQRRLDALTLTR